MSEKHDAFTRHMEASEKTFRRLDKAALAGHDEEAVIDKFFTKHHFELIEHETLKAFLFLMEFEGSQYPVSIWVPKSICRKLSREEGEVYFHDATFSRIYAEFKEKNNA